MLVHIQAEKHTLAEKANLHDRQLYETKQAQLEHEIEQAQDVLTASKLELEAAREEKRQKNECEVSKIVLDMAGICVESCKSTSTYRQTA